MWYTDSPMFVDAPYFYADVLYINEWVGLNVKILKCSYFKNSMSVLFHT